MKFLQVEWSGTIQYIASTIKKKKEEKDSNEEEAVDPTHSSEKGNFQDETYET